MNLSDYIQKLQAMEAKHGDIPVIDRDGEPVSEPEFVDDMRELYDPHPNDYPNGAIVTCREGYER